MTLSRGKMIGEQCNVILTALLFLMSSKMLISYWNKGQASRLAFLKDHLVFAD